MALRKLAECTSKVKDLFEKNTQLRHEDILLGFTWASTDIIDSLDKLAKRGDVRAVLAGVPGVGKTTVFAHLCGLDDPNKSIFPRGRQMHDITPCPIAVKIGPTCTFSFTVMYDIVPNAHNLGIRPMGLAADKHGPFMTVEDLGKELNTNVLPKLVSTDMIKWVSSVVMEGPFPGFPEDLVLIDTAGLRPEVENNQERTTAELVKADTVTIVSHRTVNAQVVSNLFKDSASNAYAVVQCMVSAELPKDGIQEAYDQSADQVQKVIQGSAFLPERGFTRRELLTPVHANKLALGARVECWPHVHDTPGERDSYLKSIVCDAFDSRYNELKRLAAAAKAYLTCQVRGVVINSVRVDISDTVKILGPKLATYLYEIICARCVDKHTQVDTQVDTTSGKCFKRADILTGRHFTRDGASLVRDALYDVRARCVEFMLGGINLKDSDIEEVSTACEFVVDHISKRTIGTAAVRQAAGAWLNIFEKGATYVDAVDPHMLGRDELCEQTLMLRCEDVGNLFLGDLLAELLIAFTMNAGPFFEDQTIAITTVDQRVACAAEICALVDEMATLHSAESTTLKRGASSATGKSSEKRARVD